MNQEIINSGEAAKEEVVGSRDESGVERRRYSDSATINGIDIKVAYGADMYELYFPQISNVSCQTFNISEDPKTAKAVFEFAKAMAKKCGNAEELMKEAEAFSIELQ